MKENSTGFQALKYKEHVYIDSRKTQIQIKFDLQFKLRDPLVPLVINTRRDVYCIMYNHKMKARLYSSFSNKTNF